MILEYYPIIDSLEKLPLLYKLDLVDFKILEEVLKLEKTESSLSKED